jgi:hypothetical protein
MSDTVRGVLTSTIGRWIAGLFALVVGPALPAIINFINNTVGYDLTDAQVQAYSQKLSFAIAGVIVTWLINRGLFERKVVEQTVSVDTDESEAENEVFEDEDENPDGSEFLPEDHSEEGDPVVPRGV